MPGEKVAVVLVPGIFASHLLDPQGGLAWPVNTFNIAVHAGASPFMQREAFSKGENFRARGPFPFKNAPENIGPSRGWQNTALQFYLPFLTDCHQNKSLSFEPLVHAIGYNFTRSNAETGKFIGAQVNRIQLDNFENNKLPRVLFVTHSMGALAVRSALQQSPLLRSTCVGVIHVAAPNAGAPESLARFLRGTVDPDSAVNLVFGDRGWKCLTSASAIPAGFELMPIPMANDPVKFPRTITNIAGSKDLPAFAADPFAISHILNTQFGESSELRIAVKDRPTGRIFRLPPSIPEDSPNDNRRWRTAKGAPEIRSNVLDNFLAAVEFHNRLGRYFFPRTAAVVLKGLDTVEKIELGLIDDRVNRAELTLGDGDGTVPLASQRYGVEEEFVGEAIRFPAIREMNGVGHSDALGEPGRPFFSKIFELMNLLYAAAPQV